MTSFETGPWQGAPGEYYLPPENLIENPRVLLESQFATDLFEITRRLAPGPAGANWDDITAQASNRLLPPMLRVGLSGDTLPVLVPGPGMGHLIIGDPTLLKVVVAEDPLLSLPPQKTMNYGERRRAQERNEIGAHLLNRDRREKLVQERQVAADIAMGLAARALAAVRPGDLQLMVCAPSSLDTRFGSFGALGNNYEFFPSEALPKMLDILDDLRAEIRGKHLGGMVSMREYAMAHGTTPAPFTMAIILARAGVELAGEDRARLKGLLDYGASAGVSLVMHGLRLDPHDDLRRLQALSKGGWSTDAAPHLKFMLDPPPPVGFVRGIATVASGRPAKTVPVSASPDDSRPDLVYHDFIVGQQDERRQFGETTAAYRKEHPFLTAQALEHHIGPSISRYPELLRATVAGGMHEIAMLCHQVAKGDPLDAMMAWAALNLINAEPENRLASAAVIALHGETATQRIRPHLAALHDVVAVTAHSGQEIIPEALRPYIAQYLPHRPPAWAFQLLADEVTPSVWRQIDPDTARVVYGDAEAAFGMRLLDGRGNVIDHAVAVAVAECRLLQLYNFPYALREVQTLLTRRAHRRLEQIDPDILPVAAREMYDACMGHLKVIGRIPTMRERAASLAGKAVTGVHSLAAPALRRLASRRQGQQALQAGEERSPSDETDSSKR